jgi:hypothetical protein
MISDSHALIRAEIFENVFTAAIVNERVLESMCKTSKPRCIYGSLPLLQGCGEPIMFGPSLIGQ